MMFPFRMYIPVALFVLFFSADGFAEELDPLSLVNSKQGIAVVVNDVPALSKSLSGLSIWEHHDIQEIRAFFALKQTGETFGFEGFQFQDDELPVAFEAIRNLLAGELYFFFEPKNRRLEKSSWILIAETGSEENEVVQCFKTLFETVSQYEADSVHGKAEFLNDGEDNDVKIFELPSGIGFWCVTAGHIFVWADKQYGTDIVSKAVSGKPPKRSFRNSRRLLAALHRGNAASFEADVPAVTIYFDLSLLKSFLPNISNEIWKRSGLSETVGSFIRFEIDTTEKQNGVPSNKFEAEIFVDGYIASTLPHSGAWKLKNAFRPIYALPALPENIYEFWCINFDAKQLVETGEEVFDSMTNSQSFEQKLKQIETQERIGIRIREDLLPCLDGTFSLAKFSNSPNPEDFGFSASVALSSDRVETKRILDLFMHGINARSRFSRQPFELQSNAYGWFWREDDLARMEQQVLKSIREYNRFREEKNLELISDRHAKQANRGYAIIDNWLVHTELKTAKTMAEKGQTSINEICPPFGEMLAILKVAQPVESPFAIWMVSPRSLETQINTMIWDYEKRKKLTTKKSFDLSDFDGKLRPLESATSLNELRDQLSIRMVRIWNEQLGHGILRLSNDDRGILISGALFRAPDPAASK